MTMPYTPLDDPELAARLDEQAKEYGTWRAKGPIYVGTALAYKKGDPVPASNVERHRYDEMDLVVKVGTKAERDAFPHEFDGTDPAADTTATGTPTSAETPPPAPGVENEAAGATTRRRAGTTTRS